MAGMSVMDDLDCSASKAMVAGEPGLDDIPVPLSIKRSKKFMCLNWDDGVRQRALVSLINNSHDQALGKAALVLPRCAPSDWPKIR